MYNSILFHETFSVMRTLPTRSHSSLFLPFVFNPLDLFFLYGGIKIKFKKNNNTVKIDIARYRRTRAGCVRLVLRGEDFLHAANWEGGYSRGGMS